MITSTTTTSNLTISNSTPLGVYYESDTGIRSLPALNSLTVMVYPTSMDAVMVSFDEGNTWNLKIIAGQTSTWGSFTPVNCSKMRFKPLSTNATYSLHGE